MAIMKNLRNGSHILIKKITLFTNLVLNTSIESLKH